MVRNFRRVSLSLPKIGPLEPMPAPDHGLKIFSSCPVSAQARPERCIRELQEFARASEGAGMKAPSCLPTTASWIPGSSRKSSSNPPTSVPAGSHSAAYMHPTASPR